MAMRSFVRAAEIWLPDPGGTELVFGGGLHGGLDAFRAETETLRFSRGDGLPGEAWAARHPIVMADLDAARFRRFAAAAQAGLTAGVAVPIFAGAALRAVVVLLCGDDAEHVGAIEVWHNDPDADAQIGVQDGYYGGAELFELTSRMKRFGKGFGIPGIVWGTGMPVVVREIYRSERFLRHEEAKQVGLSLGLGLPCNGAPDQTWVMVFLSALGTPIAERFEIWVPDGSGGLVYESGLSEGGADDTPRPASIAAGQGLLGRVLATGLPVTTEDCGADAPWLVGASEPAGAYAALAIPTLAVDGTLKAVTAWRF